MAEWPEPVEINLVALSGTYDNQPQPTTAWKIEFRRDGRWMTHARGVGGWYDRGYYLWGGPGTEPLSMDALRVSVFSRDDQTPIQSVHFRGEPGKSWIVAYCPPIAARIVPPDAPIRATQPAEFSAVPLLGEIRSWSWDFGDEERTDGRTVRHVFTRTGHVDVGLRFSDGEHTDRIRRTVTVLPPVQARIVPLTKASMAGQPVAFSAAGSFGSIREYDWDFGDGVQASGRETQHVFAKPGIYRVSLTVTDGTYADTLPALVRVHTPDRSAGHATRPVRIDEGPADTAAGSRNAGRTALGNPATIHGSGPSRKPTASPRWMAGTHALPAMMTGRTT
jgi:chitodextrinase